MAIEYRTFSPDQCIWMWIRLDYLEIAAIFPQIQVLCLRLKRLVVTRRIQRVDAPKSSIGGAMVAVEFKGE